MWFKVDPRSSTPIYLQLVQGVKEAMARGVLHPGDRLPTVREVARQLALNPNTIAKAYQLLEQEGLIETRRSRGSYVAAWEERGGFPQERRKLAEMIEVLLVEAYHLGVSHEELQGIISNKMTEWEEKRGGK